MKKILLLSIVVLIAKATLAEDGYRLWLRYDRISDSGLLSSYQKNIQAIYINANSAILETAKTELLNGLSGLLGKQIAVRNSIEDNTVVVGTVNSFSAVRSILSPGEENKINAGGFLILRRKTNGRNIILVTAHTDAGVLYGVFHLLRLLQTHQSLQQLSVASSPKIRHRILNHWDNLDRTVERGYAGFSIWNWHTLPGYIDQRYVDYARANASLGINGTVLTNVNANAMVLTPTYLQKVKALSDVFRSYGIKVFLTARFSAPIEIGGLKTADPLDADVRQWWSNKAKEIYELIPDFGGFLVKANSEGQPGPQNYKRTHADGANMLADAVAPYSGIVMWRAFVYDQQSDDRFKQAYEEFQPLDGQFRKNVMLQVKNGPIDFQPREPFSPLFGSLEKTPAMMEFQLTLEYLGQGTHLVYEMPLFREVLDADTYAKGQNSTIARIIDGSLHQFPINGIAGVANIGNDRNWTGHLFGQANWYAFGRLAWDHELSSEHIAEEWIQQTFTNDPAFVVPVKNIMLQSHETMVNYMTPLGLHHIMGNGHHYGPAPWSDDLPRPDWNPVYYHRADSIGIGFDRTATGSNALAQYKPEVRQQWQYLPTCDERYLLWFHHVGWNHKMRSGKTLWEELCYKYYKGVDDLRAVRQQWDELKPYVDAERFEHVKMLLTVQEDEAVWWRNACLLYFQTFSRMPIPPIYEQPGKTLEYYKGLRFPYAPGN